LSQESSTESLSVIRHAARGCLNSIKLCVSALELPCTPEEENEFIGDVIASSEKLDQWMDKLAHYFENAPASHEAQNT
jgi:hypothetical protein